MNRISDLMLYGQHIKYKLFNLFWIRLDPTKVVIETKVSTGKVYGKSPLKIKQR